MNGHWASCASRLHNLFAALAATALVQLTPARAVAQVCIGDCDGNAIVTVDELLRGVNIALGSLSTSQCVTFGEPVTIDHLITAVGNALNGCPVLVSGSIINLPGDKGAMTDAAVISDSGARAAVDDTGHFAIIVPAGASRVFLHFPDDSRSIYRLAVSQALPEAAVELSVEPLFGRSQSPGLTVTPSDAAPGGIASVIAPRNSESITCTAPPAVCRFLVRGLASPFLGGSGTRFSVYVLVTPVNPPGSGTFPQLPPVPVDVVTGEWAGLAQIGSEAFQPRTGDTLEVSAVVTDIPLNPPSGDVPPYPSAFEVPGAVHVSSSVELVVGERLTPLPTATDFPAATASPTVTPTATDLPSPAPQTPPPPMLLIATPRDGQLVDCTPVSNRCPCRFEVSGTFEGIDPVVEKIYVLVRPTMPFGGGWFIQAAPAERTGQGTWRQPQNFLGSNQFGACEGHTVSLVAIATAERIDHLVGPNPFELDSLPPHLQSNRVDGVVIDRPPDMNCPQACAQ